MPRLSIFSANLVKHRESTVYFDSSPSSLIPFDFNTIFINDFYEKSTTKYNETNAKNFKEREKRLNVILAMENEDKFREEKFREKEGRNGEKRRRANLI